MKLLASRLKIRHLRMVVAIVDEGNLVGAAKRLNMTQSAVTKALQELEALTGSKLFDRTNRGVVATIFGETLAEHARFIITQLTHAEEHLADLRDGTGGRIAIGTLLSASAELLPGAIARLRRERPRIVIRIVEGTGDVLVPALRSAGTRTSPVPSTMRITMRGRSRRRRAIAPGSSSAEADSSVPMAMRPPVPSRRSARCSSACVSWVMMKRACSARVSPKIVATTPRLVRSNSFDPVSASSS